MLFACSFLALVAPVVGLWALPERLSHGEMAKNVKVHELVSTAPNPESTVKYATVPLNHDDSNSKTFQLKYFVNEAAFKEGGPMVISMPQEGPTGGCGTGTVVTTLNAISICPQHRFFGDSVPFNDTSVENMRYLTVEANLADMAIIVNDVKKMYPSISSVVAAGGSYAGACSAWFRHMYPDLVDAAISYSPPLEAKIDFHEFDTSTLVALSSPDVRCARTVGKLMAAMDRQLESNKTAVYKAFGADYQLTSPSGDLDFMYGIGDAVATSVQYGQKSTICTVVAPYYEQEVDDSQYVQILADFVHIGYGQSYFHQCGYNSTCMRGETHANVADSGRSWLYVTCTELGYFQTAPPSGLTARPRGLTAKQFLGQCDYVFPGLPLISDDSVADFNRRFGAGVMGNTTKVFELDFSDDEWKMASSIKEVQRSQWPLSLDNPFMLLTCDGCGHCGAGVSKEKMSAIHEQILSVLKSWGITAPRARNTLVV